MVITLIRTGILYFFLTFAVRLMGRRQVGELQPNELVITILMSQIASQPLCDTDIPLVYSLIPIMTLISLAIMASITAMKSGKFRALWAGTPLVVIRDGVLDQKQLKRLRYTMDDIMEALRQKDVFDVSEVQYAIAENDGKLSVLLKPGKRQPVYEDMKIIAPKSSLPCVLISDGRIIKNNFADCGMDMQKLDKLLANAGLSAENVMLLTADKDGNSYVIPKEDK